MFQSQAPEAAAKLQLAQSQAKIKVLEKRNAKLLLKEKDLKKQREKMRKRCSRTQSELEKTKDELEEAYVTVQQSANLASEQSKLVIERGDEIQLLRDKISLLSFSQQLNTLLKPCDLLQLNTTPDVKFEDEFAIDNDDSFAMRYFLALFKCVQSGSSSRTQVYSFLNCLRGALPPQLNASSFKKFLERFEMYSIICSQNM